MDNENQNENKNKISVGWTIIWMFITAMIVYILTTNNYNKAILGNEDYYDTLFAIKSYSGEFEKLKKVMGVIEDDYLNEYDIEELEEGAIRGLLDALRRSIYIIF